MDRTIAIDLQSNQLPACLWEAKKGLIVRFATSLNVTLCHDYFTRSSNTPTLYNTLIYQWDAGIVNEYPTLE